jgi:hypothetical protein
MNGLSRLADLFWLSVECVMDAARSGAEKASLCLELFEQYPIFLRWWKKNREL